MHLTILKGTHEETRDGIRNQKSTRKLAAPER